MHNPLLPPPDLEPGERVLWQRPGSFSRSRGWVGGTLCVTTARVMFIPTRLAFVSFAPLKLQQYPLTDLESVGIEEKDYTPYTGGMRKRIRLAFRGGDIMLVAIKHLQEAVEEVQALMPSRG